MGEDKALLPFGGYDTLSEYQYTRLQKIFSKVYISTKDPNKFPFKADFIVDKSDVFAPTAGFVSIYGALDVERFFVLGVDMPFVDEGIIATLIEADKAESDATLALSHNGVEALCGIYHRSLQSSFKAMLIKGEHKLRKLLDEVDATLVSFSQKELFFNLNKPHEYQKAKEVYAIINKKRVEHGKSNTSG
ncbi:Molybdopterin-guanine dinucleotide biosynthesis protein MobA [hydrothermal vent metagenome]|uniref:Molybdopterin-guanine dinucleotide biosynthesis protein MobA n=1 Tax=hydrothermal vent metagenome TaxID=652676 RepID=A0A1W1BYA0_9ZZZZ